MGDASHVARRELARLVIADAMGDRAALAELRRKAALWRQEWADLAVDERTRARVGVEVADLRPKEAA